MYSERWLYWMRVGSKMGCHQMAERSFFFRGNQFPVCARCTGVLVGEIVALICMLFSVEVTFYVIMSLLIPMGIDWGLQFIKVLESTNLRRLITGTLGGFGLTYFYAWVLVAFGRWLIENFSESPLVTTCWLLGVVLMVTAGYLVWRSLRKKKQDS